MARGGTTEPFHFGWTRRYRRNCRRTTMGTTPMVPAVRAGTGSRRCRWAHSRRMHLVSMTYMGMSGSGRSDCWQDSYRDAPSDGSAWTRGGDCGKRVLRGGSWDSVPRVLRSANRNFRSCSSWARPRRKPDAPTIWFPEPSPRYRFSRIQDAGLSLVSLLLRPLFGGPGGRAPWRPIFTMCGPAPPRHTQPTRTTNCWHQLKLRLPQPLPRIS